LLETLTNRLGIQGHGIYTEAYKTTTLSPDPAQNTGDPWGRKEQEHRASDGRDVSVDETDTARKTCEIR